MKRLSIVTVLMTLCIIASAATKIWDSPAMGFSKVNQMLYVTKVEFNDQNTVLTLRTAMPGNRQIGFHRSTRVVAGGRDYWLKDMTVLTLDEPYTIPADGVVEFTMIFDPLPQSTDIFDMLIDGALNVPGIHQRGNNFRTSNWRSTTTGDWFIGFADNSIIYDKETWHITDCQQKGDTYTITATSGDLAINVKVGKEKNGCRSIGIGKQKPVVCSKIVKEYLADYPIADNTPITDNNYHEGDSVTIVGWLRNMPKEAWDISHEFSVAVPDLFTQDEKTFSAPLDSLGRFTLRMPVLNTVSTYTDWGRSFISMILEPNETYFLYKDFAEDQTLFMGRKARLNNEALANRITYYCPDYQQAKTYDNPMAFYAACDSVKAVAMQRFEVRCSEKPFLSESYKAYMQQHIINDIARILMQARFMFRDLPDEYISAVTENYWNKVTSPYGISGNNFSSFFRDYSQHTAQHLESGIGNQIKPMMLLAEKEGVLTLSDADRKVLDEYDVSINAFDKKIKAAPDSIRKDLIDEFNATDIVKKANELYDRPGFEAFFAYKITTLGCDLMGKEMKRREWNSHLQDMYFTYELTNRINNTRQPLHPSLLSKIDTYITAPYGRNLVHRLNDKYEALSRQEFDPSILHSADNVNELSEGAEILNKILEPYRGKLVLLDIWGTWCGPCKERLAHSQEEYERLNKYDIIYLYLANRSDQKSWENVIKEYNVTGQNVVHYNLPDAKQKAIENHLSVRAFPTYKLFDREGHLLDIPVDTLDMDNLEDIIKKLQ